MLFILILFTIVLYKYLNNRPNSLKRFLGIETLILIIISSLRNVAIGNDTYNYLILLESAQFQSFSDIVANFLNGYLSIDYSNRDPGYALFQKLVSSITTTQVPFFLIIAIITLVPFAYFNKVFIRSKKHILFSYIFFIFFLYSNFPNQFIRQSCAFSLMCLGYICIKKQKKWQCLILFVLASTFHKSALLLIPMYLMYRFIAPRFYLWIGIGGFALAILLPQQIFNLLGESMAVYSNYFNSDLHFSIIIVYFLFALYGLFFYPILTKKIDAETIRLELCGSTWSFMLCPSIYIDPSAFRTISYFLIWNCVLLPMAIDCYQYRKSIVAVIYVLFLAKTIPHGEIKWFYWQKMELNDIYYSKNSIIMQQENTTINYNNNNNKYLLS